MDNKDYDLTEQFFRLFGLMHRYQMYNSQSLNPHRGQGRVLAILNMQPEITQKELGYLLDMRNQSLGELLAKLEKAGYITRTPSEKDKRTTNIKLTELGAVAAKKAGSKSDDFSEVFDCLADEEKDNFNGYIEKIAGELEHKLRLLDPQNEKRFGQFFGRDRIPPHGNMGGPGAFDDRRHPGHDPRRPSPDERRGFGPFDRGFGIFNGRDGRNGREPFDNSHYENEDPREN